VQSIRSRPRETDPDVPAIPQLHAVVSPASS
jgi:hypothetical protein